MAEKKNPRANRYGRVVNEKATAKLHKQNAEFKNAMAMEKAMEYGPIGLRSAALRALNKGFSYLLKDKDSRRMQRHAAKAHKILKSRSKD